MRTLFPESGWMFGPAGLVFCLGLVTVMLTGERVDAASPLFYDFC